MEAIFGDVGIRPVERFISNFNGKNMKFPAHTYIIIQR